VGSTIAFTNEYGVTQQIIKLDLGFDFVPKKQLQRLDPDIRKLVEQEIQQAPENMKAGSIFGKLPIPINEVEDPSVPRQLTDRSCGIACGQMLLDSIGVKATHAQIVKAAGDDFLNPEELAKALRDLSFDNWTFGVVFPEKRVLDKYLTSPLTVQFAKGYIRLGLTHSNLQKLIGIEFEGEALNWGCAPNPL